MLALADIAELWRLREDKYSVMVVKHDYEPKGSTKFLGNIQSRYVKKNWSSVILFNNALCTALTPRYVGTASGLELHQFQWLGNDAMIGSLPLEWNHLVGEYTANPSAKLIHFTLGGPWWRQYSDCEYSRQWFEFRQLVCGKGS
ncbi:MAG: hypothetical protein MN733_21905 [Nitrososphaera sp.]|nr:hypothetical protein [Nitrososphaera sp.]